MMGFVVEQILPQGTLITGDLEKFKESESKGFRVNILPKHNILKIGSYVIDVENESLQILDDLQIADNLKDIWPHHLIQCQGPPTAGWIKEIENTGVDVVEPISSCGLFVYGSPDKVDKLTNFSFVTWAGPFLPAYRINRNLQAIKGNIRYIGIGIYPSSSLDTVKSNIQKMGGKIVERGIPEDRDKHQYARLLVESNSELVSKIACLPTVRWLDTNLLFLCWMVKENHR